MHYYIHLFLCTFAHHIASLARGNVSSFLAGLKCRDSTDVDVYIIAVFRWNDLNAVAYMFDGIK